MSPFFFLFSLFFVYCGRPAHPLVGVSCGKLGEPNGVRGCGPTASNKKSQRKTANKWSIRHSVRDQHREGGGWGRENEEKNDNIKADRLGPPAGGSLVVFRIGRGSRSLRRTLFIEWVALIGLLVPTTLRSTSCFFGFVRVCVCVCVCECVLVFDLLFVFVAPAGVGFQRIRRWKRTERWTWFSFALSSVMMAVGFVYSSQLISFQVSTLDTSHFNASTFDVLTFS